MRKLLPLLACLMLVFTSWSVMARAAEAAGGTTTGIAFTVHTPGDGDEVPADSDNGLPHHHGLCHGHDVGTPETGPSQPCRTRETSTLSGSPARALVASDQSVPARPPRA
ncbi:MAG: hypothetical protein J0I25_09870 [Sphingomonadales bacterium]|nr:hypothetical protein [Sphingomonadales bacterium]